MDLVEMFLRDHATAHSSKVAVAEGQFSLEDSRLRGLTEEQIRLCPGWNSIAWLLWHMARAEDVGINVIVADRPQVFDEGGWARRLGIVRRDLGTGMADGEVAELSAQIDIPRLREYRVAVGRRTREIARSLAPQEWDRVVDAASVQKAVDQGAVGPNAGAAVKFWEGKSIGWFFYWIAVGHNQMHMGHVGWVREMVVGTRAR